MTSRVLSRLTYANIMSTLAVVLLMGGVSYAAVTLGANSVGNRELKDNAVTGAEVKNKSLKAGDFANGQLPAGPRGPAGPAACDDGLLCEDKDLPAGWTVVLTVDATPVGQPLSALRIDCMNPTFEINPPDPTPHKCTIAVAGAVTSQIAYHSWYEQAFSGDAAAIKDFSVLVRNSAGTVVRRYLVTNGVPVGLRDNAARFELTINAEFVQRVSA